MRSLRIVGYTRELATGQDEYHNLCIRDEIINVPGVGKCAAMTSAWEPTPQQLRLLLDGGKIKLQILGTVHPPVALWVEAPEPVDERNNEAGVGA